jgi:hypothetical protein
LIHTAIVDINTSSTTHLTDEQRIDWLRLIRSDNVGPRGIMAQTPPGKSAQSFAPNTVHLKRMDDARPKNDVPDYVGFGCLDLGVT